MEIRELFADDKAVSPVIGVILMVAITVILAAVIGTFVLGLGDQVSSSAPQVSFTFNFDDSLSGNCGTAGSGTTGGLEITHDGGDKLDGGNIFINGDGYSSKQEWNSDCSGGTEITAGDQITVTAGSGDVVRVIWENPNGGDTNTLGKWTGPDA